MRALFLLLTALLLAVPAAATARSQDAQRALSTAQSLIAQGLPDAALVRLREAREFAPNDVEIHTEYIDLMLAEQFPNEVLADYEGRRAAGTSDAIYLHGRVRAQVGDIEGSRSDFKAALAQEPTHHWSLQGLAGLALLEGRAEDARDLFISARAVAPERAEIHNKLAAVLVRTGDTEGAYASWKKATEVDPADHHAWLNWGAMLSRNGDQKAALVKLEVAVQKAPGHPLAHVNLAYVYAKQEQYDDAIAHFDAALAINPRNTTVAGSRELLDLINTGKVPGTAFSPMAEAMEAEAVNPPLAKQKYGEVILLAPKFAPAHMRLGLVLASLQDAEGSIASLRKAAELAPDDPATRYNLGYLLLGLEKTDEAMPHLMAAHKLAPKDPDAITGIALGHLSKGDPATSLIWYDKALANNPLDPTLWVQYGTTQAAMGDFDQGIKSVRKALEVAPGFVAARAQLVSILREARQYDAALAELAQLEKMAPGNASIAAERTTIEAARRAYQTSKASGVRVSQILLLDEGKANAALAKLDGGSSFGSVAREFGQGPEAGRGGDVGYVDPKEMRAEIASVVQGLQAGQRSGVISLGKAWLIVKRTE
ncbi:MAG: tetratricopeptide repeat protein [Deltaproteobacteria bacterium]|nr:tetratricopeptide repeat protein [Deltaproteobacteria bacterium]